MKKFVFALIICIFAAVTLSFTACDDSDSTYYPNSNEMKSNLENCGYAVTLTNNLDNKSGTYLQANSGEDFIYFYWLENAADCEYFYDILEVKCPENYNALAMIQNDVKYGNIVYCGTKNAVDAAGIKVVDVKVKV